MQHTLKFWGENVHKDMQMICQKNQTKPKTNQPKNQPSSNLFDFKWYLVVWAIRC